MRFSETVKHAFSRLGRVVTAGFHVDLRSLALARMAFGSLLVVDLVNRVAYLEAHYADAGVLPRKALLTLGWPRWFVSLHLMSGEPAVQLVLFGVAGVLALMLLLGYRTRLVTILSWLLLMSLHNRNQMILNGGDSLFRILLFWGMFVPWGARWSVDRALIPDAEPGPDRVFSVGALAFFVQTCAVYFFTALLKSGADWWETGLAVYYALSLDIMRLPLGTFVYQFPEFMRFMTAATLWLELVGPFIFFIPFANTVFRWLGVAVFMTFQLGLGATLQVGLFPWVSIAALVAFLPSATWTWVNLRFLDRGFEGVAFVARRFRLKGAQPFLTLSKLEGVVVVFLLAYVLVWNAATLRAARWSMPKDVKWIGQLLRLNQKWDMFARPMKNDGWFVFHGELRNGQEVDVFRGLPYVTFDKPDDVVGEFGGMRWRKFLTSIYTSRYRKYRPYYSRYLCRVWNRDHSYAEQLMSLKLVVVKEKTLPDYQVEKPKQIVLWRYTCFKNKYKGKKVGIVSVPEMEAEAETEGKP